MAEVKKPSPQWFRAADVMQKLKCDPWMSDIQKVAKAILDAECELLDELAKDFGFNFCHCEGDELPEDKRCTGCRIAAQITRYKERKLEQFDGIPQEVVGAVRPG